MKHIVFHDAVHLRQIIDFARQTKSETELGLALIRLLEVATIGMIKPYSASAGEQMEEVEGVDMTTVIGKDWAPYSLAFGIFDGASALLDRPEGRRLRFNGGFIYSGPGVPANGSYPSLTVSLDPDAHNGAKHMWSIHT